MSFSQGPTDKKYISAFGIDRRDWLPQVLDLQNDEYLTEMLEIGKRYKIATVPEYSEFVADAMFILLDSTGATVTGTGTATVGTTLTTGTSGYVRPTDLVKFPNGKVGYVVSNTPSGGQDVLSIKSINGTVLTHTAGQKLSVFSNAFGEKSTSPVNRKFGQTMYTNKIQTFREVNSITDIQLASEVELTWKGEHFVINRDMYIKAQYFKAWVNGAMFGGSMSVTRYADAVPAITDPISGGAVQTTRGLDEYITTYGINDAVATPGTWNFADLEDVINQTLVAKTGRNFIVLRGTKASMPMDRYLKGINSGISAGKLSLDGKSFDYNVDMLNYAGRSFQFSTMGILDNQEFFSQTDIVQSIYFIPTDSVKTQDGGTQPRIQMRYMPHNVKGSMGDEIYAQWEDGGLAVTGPTNDELVRRTSWATHQGLQVLGAQHFVKSVVL